MRETRDFDAALDDLLQVIRELDGLLQLQEVVPRDLLWDHPPGLPSGVELLWLIHLVDTHVFLPAAAPSESPVASEWRAPDYLELLEKHPCSAESLEALMEQIRASRSTLIDELRGRLANPSTSDATARELVKIIRAHDRRVLVALTERLYESGLGA